MEGFVEFIVACSDLGVVGAQLLVVTWAILCFASFSLSFLSVAVNVSFHFPKPSS